LNVCHRIDVLKLRAATVNVTLDLCGTGAYKSHSKVEEILNYTCSWIISND